MDLMCEHDGKFQERPLSDGEHVLGEADGVPARLGLSLFVEGGRLSIEAAAPVRVGGVLLPPRLRRLVMPGEPIEPVPGRVFRIRPQAGPAAPATRAVVRHLLEQGASGGSASLVSLTGLDAGRTLPLGDQPVVIGRGDGAGLRLRDRAISRLHARLTPEGDGHAIEDLGTANGVHVNGARVIGRHLLEEGALVELGQTLLRYSTGRAPADAAPDAEANSTAGSAEAPGTSEGDAAGAAGTPGPAGAAGGGSDGTAGTAGREAAASGAEGAQVIPLSPGERPAPPEASEQASEEASDASPPAGDDEDEAREPGAGMRWLLASGVTIFLLGVGLTVGCLSYAQSAQARSGERPARSTTSSASRR
jgi:hypothetical protein